jgi:hypothetical protein
MIRVRISRLHSAVILIAVAVLVGALTATVYAKYKGTPLSIAFSSPFPSSSLSQIEICHAQITWTNKDAAQSYSGSFLFAVTGKNFKIKSADISFTFAGTTMNPIASGKSLLFYLPQQTFLTGSTGSISVDVVFNTPGVYSWDIGIVQR